MSKTPKLPPTKSCSSCGWIARLQPDPDREEPLIPKGDFSPIWFYTCSNPSCEHAERAGRAA